MSMDKNQRSQRMTNVLNHIDCVPSNVQFSHQEALLCLRTTKQWSRWSSREGVPQWDTFPGPTELRLIGCSIESTWTPKTQIKYIDTKNQLADILIKGNFTRDEWNHLLCLFNISHFISTVCSETLAKRLQQDSGGERVTAKSRPMMSLIARVPSNVSSSTSVSREKRSYGNQNPWSTIAEFGETRIWQVCHRWRWCGPLHRHRIEPFVNVTVILAQGEWSIAKDIGPFSRRCNARHRQTFCDLVNVYVFDSGSICIHGEELLRQFTFHQKYREQYHFETDVWHIWKVDSRTIR